MPPNGPIDDGVSPLPFTQDYPSPTSDVPSTSTSTTSLRPTKSSFVFDSSTSRTRGHGSSGDLGRPTLSTFSSFISLDGTSGSNSSTPELSGSVLELPSWGHPESTGNSMWQRPRAYKTRLTAGECFEHAFSSSHEAREWERARALTTTLTPSSSSLPLMEVSDSTATTLTRRNSSGLLLTYERAQCGIDRYKPPAKGTFTSNLRFLHRRRLEYNLAHSNFDISTSLLLSQSTVSTASSRSSSRSTSPNPISMLSFAGSASSLAVRERLLSREEWKIASANRKKRKQMNQRALFSDLYLNDDASACNSVNYLAYTNPEPISISGECIGGCLGFGIAPPTDMLRHPSLRRRDSQSMYHIQNMQKHSARSTSREGAVIPAENANDRERSENDTDDDIMFALRRLQIFSQLAWLIS